MSNSYVRRALAAFCLVGLTSLANASNGGSGGDASGLAVTLMLLGLGLYFLPTIVATARGHANHMAILVLNLLLGWTGLGWVGALVWACTGKNATTAVPAAAARATTERVKTCPFCAETIQAAAIKCKHCGSDLRAAPPTLTTRA